MNHYQDSPDFWLQKTLEESLQRAGEAAAGGLTARSADARVLEEDAPDLLDRLGVALDRVLSSSRLQPTLADACIGFAGDTYH